MAPQSAETRPPKGTVLPCNFRSAGRLSNESARTLTTLHETLARNLMNSLDVYLGTGLEVQFGSLAQMSMEEYRVSCLTAGYILPCTVQPASSMLLLEIDSDLMFTVIDLLLGGSGTKQDVARDLTEIDEEIMHGVGTLIAQEVERVWSAVGFSLSAGSCVKPTLAHKVFPPTEKVLRIRFDVSVEGITGALYVAFQASLGSHLVRNVKSDPASRKAGSRYLPRPSLAQRMLDCKFNLAGEIPQLRVNVRELSELKVGSVLRFSTPVASNGSLTLANKAFFEAAPVGQGNNRAMQLLDPIQPHQV